MKNRTGTRLDLIVLALCVVLLLVLVQGLGNTPFRSAARPLQSPIQPTALPTVDIVATWNSAAATLAVQATATTAARLTAVPTVVPTLTALPSGQRCYVDPVNGFSLFLSPGWYASPPLSTQSGFSTVYNYDPNLAPGSEGFPPGSIKIEIGVGQLEAGRSLEQWVADRIALETSVSPIPVTTTLPNPLAIGKYAGLSFVISSSGSSALEIALRSEQKIMSIGLTPSDSSALPQALDMLATLDISGPHSCPAAPAVTQETR